MQTSSLTYSPIDERSIRKAVEDPAAGAVVLFMGTTRRWTQGRETLWLDYACHEPLAIAELDRVILEARRRWGLCGCAIQHRLGRIEIGEASLVVGVSSPHRRHAFDAAAWMLDEVKRTVPIWKQEHWADGSDAWVHPTGKSADASSQPQGQTVFSDANGITL